MTVVDVSDTSLGPAAILLLDQRGIIRGSVVLMVIDRGTVMTVLTNVAVGSMVVAVLLSHRGMRRLVAEEHRPSRESLQGKRGHDEPGDDETEKRHDVPILMHEIAHQLPSCRIPHCLSGRASAQ